ncbi:hypothetical protein L2E82_48964 [Cichorium intybus]|uniref:Uncharacterized protein n=1 Tax=Cichorium intybus TaxID=13427 RepID=A0ACB8YYD2_CICIN|nr:hypothetical protein L2E82_48964 [Cichorium intybus]
MRSIADDLALAQSPVLEEDLMVHILSQLCDDYSTIVAAIKVRDTPLLEHNITTDTTKPPTPTAHVTTSAPASPQWLFDTGASNHVASDRNTLHQVSEYGGPDEIVLGDGSEHGGATHARREG